MTETEKIRVESMRANGMSYGQIGKALNISADTVKTFCNRRKIKVSKSIETKDLILCKFCGKIVQQSPKRKLKKFCSDKCRMLWWNQNLDKVNKKAMHDFTCAYCGKKFTAYSVMNRKFCSHRCYIQNRFGGDHNE